MGGEPDYGPVGAHPADVVHPPPTPLISASASAACSLRHSTRSTRLLAYPEWRYWPGAGCRTPFGSTRVPELGASRSWFLLGGMFAEPVVGAEVAHPATATPAIPSTAASIPFKEVPAQIMTRAFHGFLLCSIGGTSAAPS